MEMGYGICVLCYMKWVEMPFLCNFLLFMVAAMHRNELNCEFYYIK